MTRAFPRLRADAFLEQVHAQGKHTAAVRGTDAVRRAGAAGASRQRCSTRGRKGAMRMRGGTSPPFGGPPPPRFGDLLPAYRGTSLCEFSLEGPPYFDQEEGRRSRGGGPPQAGEEVPPKGEEVGQRGGRRWRKLGGGGRAKAGRRRGQPSCDTRCHTLYSNCSAKCCEHRGN